MASSVPGHPSSVPGRLNRYYDSRFAVEWARASYAPCVECLKIIEADPIHTRNRRAEAAVVSVVFFTGTFSENLCPYHHDRAIEDRSDRAIWH